MNYGKVCLLAGAAIASFTAMAHMSCIFLGPQCYSFQMAPPQIIASAKNGTLLAPIGTSLVSLIFLTFSLYALSAANVIARLPLLKIGIYSISTLCIVRGLLPLQLWLRHPDKVSDFAFYAGVLWLITGLFYGLGFRNVQKT